MEQRQSFQQTVQEELDFHMQNNEPIRRPYTFTKGNSKCITDLNVKCKTMKLLEEDNTGENLDDLFIKMTF